MKIVLAAVFSLLQASASVQARQQDTVFVADCGIHPHTYENQHFFYRHGWNTLATARAEEVAPDRPVPQALEPGHDCVANMNCTPEVEIRNRPVHRNVRIIGNRFQLSGNPVLYAKSTEGLVFKDNEVEQLPGTDAGHKELFVLNGCRNVEIEEHVLPHALSIGDIRFENMKRQMRTDPCL